MHHRTLLAALLALLVMSVPAAGVQAADAQSSPGQPRLDWAGGGVPGAITGAAAQALLQGPLLDDPAMVAQRKALAPEKAGEVVPKPLAATPAPTVLLGKNGIAQVNITPSDSTGAIGTTRYIETINSKVGLFDVNLKLIKQDTLENWWGMAGASVFDPQVIWDPSTKRFYYTGCAVFSNTDNRLAFGFSKTDSPSSAVDDWCRYQIGYGAEFPDYPKLGDSRDFAVIGVNVFTDVFRGSDILAVGKPPAGTACPDPTALAFALAQNIKVGNALYFTPTPANGIDSNGNAWIVTRSSQLPATKIGLFKVSKDGTTGAPIVSAKGSAITVPAYDVPPGAPQKDTTFILDTLDARMTQAVAAIDPARGNKFAVWTQHTIKGGAGSMVRWYEIDPAGKVVLQSGDVQHASLYFFNGAISPDRVVRAGVTSAFGSNMLLNFTASSETTYPSIRMVAKRGTDGTSAVKLVKSSPGPDIDFSCLTDGTCRWGDYAAATPDPNAPTDGAAGIVWGTNMWTKDGNITGTDTTSWQTWNWKSQP